MARTVFWSWQSDRPGKTNRHFLRDVVARAIAHASVGMDLEERPEIDHDVQGTAGIVAIPETILAKIDAADVFVADLTPVARTVDGKHVANPNVLIELGYAKKSLGPERIVLVWNAAWGGCEPEDLPFDLRHRRAPFRYTLSPERTGGEREAVAVQLVPEIGNAIRASLATVPTPPVIGITRIKARNDDASVWFDAGAEIVVASGRSIGADRLYVPETARCYIRIAPAKWESGRLTGVTDDRHEIMPLGDVMGLSWGRTRGGVIAYETEETRDGKSVVLNATQWFQSNGEIWGFDGRITYGIDQAHAGLAVDYVIQCWKRFLLRHARTFDAYGVRGPFVIEAGVTGFQDLFWPQGRYSSSLDPAIEETILTRRQISSINPSHIDTFIRQAADDVRDAYGRGPFTEQELARVLADTRAQA